MRVLMFGWEFPPNMSGGLGTACEGIANALAASGHQVRFVLPRGPGVSGEPGLHFIQASEMLNLPEQLFAVDPYGRGTGLGRLAAAPAMHGMYPGGAPGPYVPCPGETDHARAAAAQAVPGPSVPRPADAPPPPMRPEALFEDLPPLEPPAVREQFAPSPAPPAHALPYGAAAAPRDMLDIAELYGNVGRQVAEREQFDVIHCHDWFTVPAGLAARDVSGRPLVLHIHSMERDRAGGPGMEKLRDLERIGVLLADRVVAVSEYSRQRLIREYGLPPAKIAVIHNAVQVLKPSGCSAMTRQWHGPVVSFVGRITRQKAPQSFIKAASHVLSHVPSAQFVLAGDGDMLAQMQALAYRLGISSQVHFTGFLSRSEVADVLAASDVYVMPSQSEPFGIAAIEAAAAGVPVILSDTCGVCEVLCDTPTVPWDDIRFLSDVIVSVLESPIRQHQIREANLRALEGLTWDHVADRLAEVYREVVEA